MESIPELSLNNPGDYTMWRREAVNLAKLLGFEEHLTNTTERLVKRYKEEKVLIAETVPFKVRENESYDKDGRAIYNELNVSHIQQSGAKLFSAIKGSLSIELRRLTGTYTSSVEVLNFIEQRFKAVQVSHLEETKAAFSSLHLKDQSKYAIFMDEFVHLKNELSALGAGIGESELVKALFAKARVEQMGTNVRLEYMVENQGKKSEEVTLP